MFWTLFSDPRPISVHSGDLETNLQPADLVRRSNKIDFQQTYGAIDLSATLNGWTSNRRVKGVDIAISFKNLDNYFKVKNRFGYIFSNQGNLDKDGITTIYHELEHARDFINLDSGLNYLGAIKKIREGEYEVDNEGKIVNPGVYSILSRAQKMGESVYRDVKNKKDGKINSEDIINLIKDRMTVLEDE